MELKAIQVLSRAARDEIRSMSHKGFYYGRVFEIVELANERCALPHIAKAEELGLHVDGVPVSSVLTKLSDAERRIGDMFNAVQIEEEGIDIKAMFTYMTEQEIIDELEDKGIEKDIGTAEIEFLINCDEWQIILQIPQVKRAFFDLRQMEEITPGHYADISAFNTVDYLRNVAGFEFDKYLYMTDKVAERAEDLAVMHSCLATQEGRNAVRHKFVVLTNGKYRDYALRLLAMHNATEDKARKEELLEKLDKQNMQIRRLKQIWQKNAFSK